MSRLSVATLTGGLLVAKGTAGPSFISLCEDPLAPPSPSRDPRPTAGSTPPSAETSRLTLRVDAIRHRRLRIAAAQFGQSQHAVIIAALDHYLDAVVPTLLNTQCHCLAAESAAVAAGVSMFSRPAP
jgi:hypothetical protein